MRWLIFFHLLLISTETLSQLPQADFLVTPKACINEKVKFVNQSSNAVSYEWDLCDGDLTRLPQAQILANNFGGYGTRVAVFEDNSNFFGFFLSGGTRSLYRLNFGSEISSNPTLTDLGGLGLNSNQLRAIEIVKEDDGKFYGFIIDSERNKLYRIDFGLSLSNTPQNAIEIFSGSPLNTPMEFTVVQEGDNRYIFLVNSGDGVLAKLKFENKFNSSISVTSSLLVSNQWLNGVTFLKSGTTWHGLVVSPLTAEVFKLDYVNGLDGSSPAITSISVAAPMGVSLVNENGLYHGFVQSRNASLSLFRLDFGSSLAGFPASISEINNIQYDNTQLWGYSMFRQQSRWIALATESGGNNIYRLKFPNNCFSSVENATVSQPIITALNPGNYSIALSAIGSNGEIDYVRKTFEVSNNTSPDIEFDYNNICTNHNVNFISENVSGDVTLFDWSFGDSQTASVSNPTHQYISPGNYLVTLKVAASNGCYNHAERNILIYDPPLASFDSPNAIICTNNQFTFTNNTLDNFNGNLSYEWFVNDELKSTNRIFNYTFTTTGNQSIRLKTSIPGCFSEQTQQITNVQSGPVVDFSYSGRCEGENIMFNNESVGAISGFEWNFGNGNTSVNQNPTQIYTNKGQYDVTLSANGTNGCVSSVTQNITVYSRPQTDFIIELPPFSCTGSASQFRDQTPAMSDSNIASWSWSFGDSKNGTSATRNPQYTYDLAQNYLVTLTTISNFGCSGSKQMNVNILQSPTANFEHEPACLSQSTQFQDASTSDVKSWLWTIQGNVYSAKNPSHTFRTAAEFPVTLAVTANNNCVGRITKNVNIPISPEISFKAISTCEGIPSVFQGISFDGEDEIKNWKWQFGDGGSGEGEQVSHAYQNTGSYLVNLEAIAESGCVYPYAQDVQIIKAPQANFSVPFESGAAPFTVTVTNHSEYATKFSWKSGKLNDPPTQQFSPSFIYEQLGEYTLELEASNERGCKDVQTEIIKVVIPEYDGAVTDFTLNAAPGNSSYSPVVTIFNNGNVPLIQPEISIEISGNSSLIETIPFNIKPNQTLTYTFTTRLDKQSLTYACAYLSVNSDRDIFNNRECTSPRGAILINPYPNPATDKVFIDWIGTAEIPMEVKIFNAAGQLLFEKIYQSPNTGLSQVEIDVSQLASGVYLIDCGSSQTSGSYRFSIVR